MNQDNVVIILDQLIQKTKERKLNWERTSKTGTYKCSFKKGIIIIENNQLNIATQNSAKSHTLSFVIYDDEGEKVFEKNTGGLAAQFEIIMNNSPTQRTISEKIAELFQAIEGRQGDKLKDIMNELLGL